MSHVEMIENVTKALSDSKREKIGGLKWIITF
jgi:hypothetical protein